MTREETIAHIKKALNHFDKNSPKIAILLVVNLQTDDIEKDYEQFSIATTYSSDKELEEMLTAFKSFADYTNVSYGEKDFIRKLETGYFNDLKEFEKIVYSESTTGLSRSMSALIPTLCELYKLKYCSNDSFTGAMLDNKMASFGVLKSHGISLPDTWFYYHKIGWMGNMPFENDGLLISKPAYGCASLGISDESVSNMNEPYGNFIHNLSLKFNQPIMVQKLIEGYEVEVPVFNLAPPFTPGTSGISRNGKKELGKEVLSYATIFANDFNLYGFDLFKSDIAEKLKQCSITAYSFLQLKGPVRFDYRITLSGEYYLIDYNNSPHLGTQHSFAFVLTDLGFSYSDMLKLVVYSSLFENKL